MNIELKHLILRELKHKNVMGHNKSDRQIWIACPYHKEKEPSLGINIGKSSVPIGVWHCFGCHESGSWNKIAAKLGLQQVKDDRKTDLTNVKDPFAILGSMIEEDEVGGELPKSLMPWTGDWKPERVLYTEAFLRKMGAQKWFDGRSDIFRILFPVTMHREIVGYISHRLDKETKPKHRNAPGKWAKKHWLGFDTLKPVNNTAVIVEGGTDRLRLSKYGIPTLAMMGLNNWSEMKKAALVSLGLKNLVIFFDGDTQGHTAAEELRKELRRLFSIKVVKLPIREDKEKRIDPGNCPRKYINEVKDWVFM